MLEAADNGVLCEVIYEVFGAHKRAISKEILQYYIPYWLLSNVRFKL